jgi:hypothetical protein
MRLRALPLVVLLATLAPAGAAHATPVTGSDGVRCGLIGVLDPTAEPGNYVGVVDAGPLFVTDPDTGVAGGTVRCTVQVAPLHSDGGLYQEMTGTGVVEMPPKLLPYQRGSQPIYICTRFTYSTGQTFYWSNGWTTNAATPCDVASTINTPQAESLLDAIVCPILAAVPVVGNTLQNLWGCSRNVLPPATEVDDFRPGPAEL